MFFQNGKQVRAYAKSLHKSLKDKFPDLSRGDVLNALARARGYEDWNALSDALSEDSISALLSDFELAHAHDSAEADLRADETGGQGYGEEVILQVHTGFFLKAPAFPSECDYVRVCDPLGREVMYWSSAEWQSEPAEVMGAILGALVRGKSLSPKQINGTETASTLGNSPKISDLDFMKIHFVVMNNQGFRIVWREEAALAFIGRKDRPGYENWEEETADGDTTALLLQYEEDGLVYEESLTVEDLSDLSWSEKHEAFVNREGVVFTFYTEEKFSPRRASKPKKLYRMCSSEGISPYDLMFLVDANRVEHIEANIERWLAEQRAKLAASPDDASAADWTASDVIAKMEELGAQHLEVEEGPAWE